MDAANEYDHLLSPRERKLRKLFLSRPSEVWSSAEILEYIGSHTDEPVGPKAPVLVRLMISRIRDTFDGLGFIVAIPRTGYVFLPVTQSQRPAA